MLDHRRFDMKQKRIVFQAALSEQDMNKLKAIAEHRQVKMSEAFRAWIRNTHKAIEAKR